MPCKLTWEITNPGYERVWVWVKAPNIITPARTSGRTLGATSKTTRVLIWQNVFSPAEHNYLSVDENEQLSCYW